MGTRVLGSQTTGPSSLAFWLNPSSNSNMKADNPVFTMSEDGYIDGVFVYAMTQNGAAATAANALYNAATSVKLLETPLYTLSGSIGWQGQGTSGLVFIGAGTQVQGAVWTNTNGLEIYAINNGGNFEYLQSTFHLPSPWSGGTVKNSWGGLGWYATYFPAATITGLTATPVAPGQSFSVTGQSFSAGVSSVKVGSVTVSSYTVNSDTSITATLPVGATTAPVTVVTNAGTATSAASLIVSSAYLIRSGSPSSSQGIYLIRSGTPSQSQGIQRYKSGAWVNPQ